MDMITVRTEFRPGDLVRVKNDLGGQYPKYGAIGVVENYERGFHGLTACFDSPDGDRRSFAFSGIELKRIKP